MNHEKGGRYDEDNGRERCRAGQMAGLAVPAGGHSGLSTRVNVAFALPLQVQAAHIVLCSSYHITDNRIRQQAAKD